jgi:hypothetical protein
LKTGGKAAVIVVAVRMCRYYKYQRFMDTEHFFCFFVNGNLPFFRKKPAAFFVDITAGNKNTIFISGDCSCVGAGFFTKSIFFKQRGNASKANYGGFDLFHVLRCSFTGLSFFITP